MGQQQLLLLVLATVIVGLATVAGIQAFDENRSQAAADALQQKAMSITSDIKGLDEKPQQMGGIPEDLSSSSVSLTDVAARLGFENTNSDGSGTYYVSVSGAGENSSEGASAPTTANCQMNGQGTNQLSVVCKGKGDYDNLIFYGVYKQDGDPEIKVQPTDPSSGGGG